MLRDTKRFGEIRATLAGVSPKALTDRLRELEKGGLITRTVYPQVPLRVDYTLTEKGDAIAMWGQIWTQPFRVSVQFRFSVSGALKTL